jgi:CMP-N,N'-diacetyllegionaminic acid synthase
VPGEASGLDIAVINGRRILAVVLARGGSKGLPGKNLMPLGGKPMIAWSVVAARESRLVDRAIVSTDDPAIAEAAKRAGGDVPFLRPAEFARDESTVHESMVHALDQLGEPFDYVVALQATSPLRTGADIDGAIVACEGAGATTCISVVSAPKSLYWSFAINREGRLAPVLDSHWQTRRRQELPAVYLPNGAVYVARVDWYRQNLTFVGSDTVPYVMPQERSLEVDSALDMTLINALFTGNSIITSGKPSR